MGKKLKRSLLWALLLLALAGLVWAAAELSGQANKSAADAGSNAADMEMASLEMIKPSKTAPNCNWALEKKLRKELERIDKDYRKILARAQSDIAGNSGKVSPETRAKGMKSAELFKATSEKYAAMWDKCKCTSRAKLARETGESRMKSAAMAFNDVDSDNVDAYNEQQDSMAAARRAYVEDAKTDLSDKDRAALKSNLLPKAEKIADNLAALGQGVTGLLGQIQSQATDPVAIGGCARQVVSDTGPEAGSATALLSPVKSLMSLIQSMTGNVQGMISDIMTLSD